MIDSTTPGAATGAASGTAAPGWYPDGSGGQRWWDGRAWSDHVAPAARTAPPARTPLPEGARIDTGWVWLVALITWVAVIPIFFFDFPGYMRAILSRDISGAVGWVMAYMGMVLVVSMGAYAVAVISAFRDYKHLAQIGLVRPFHWAFAFIGPIVYLIGRHVVLRQVSRTAGWPVWIQIAFFVLYLVALFAWMAIMMQQMFATIPLTPGGFR